MFRRVILALITLALLCGPAAAAEKFIVASDCTWPPMEMLDANKQPEGFSTDYLRAMGKAAGFEVEVRNIAWDGIFGGVATGQYDIVASSVTITPEREKQFDFSAPYYEVVQAVVLPAGKSIKTLADLKGKKVGVQIGTTAIEALRKMNVDIDLRTYDEVGLVFEDMRNGRLDVVVCDDPVARYYASRKEGYKDLMKVAFLTEDVEYIGFVFSKDNAELAAQVNKGLKAIRENGKEKAIRNKWLGE